MKFSRKLILPGLAVLLAAGAAARLSEKPTSSPVTVNELSTIALARTSAEPSDNGSAFSAVVSDSGPEEVLARIFKEIEANRLSNALALTEALLRQHPNYRLANLIKGDLLLARRQPIQSFGALNGAPAEKVADLRAEAIARLTAYREKPPTDFVPRYLLQMQPDQRFAIVVDTKRSRLYVYENDKSNDGRPRFVADYYITQGKLGAEKLVEGDKKTPVGVYHVTANLPKQKLADLYGSGAFPLNYPNEWDKRQGRNGVHSVTRDFVAQWILNEIFFLPLHRRAVFIRQGGDKILGRVCGLGFCPFWCFLKPHGGLEPNRIGVQGHAQDLDLPFHA